MCDLSVSNVSFTYVGALVLGHRCSGLRLHLDVPVMSINCPFPFLLIDFSLKSMEDKGRREGARGGQKGRRTWGKWMVKMGEGKRRKTRKEIS